MPQAGRQAVRLSCRLYACLAGCMPVLHAGRVPCRQAGCRSCRRAGCHACRRARTYVADPQAALVVPHVVEGDAGAGPVPVHHSKAVPLGLPGKGVHLCMSRSQSHGPAANQPCSQPVSQSVSQSAGQSGQSGRPGPWKVPTAPPAASFLRMSGERGRWATPNTLLALDAPPLSSTTATAPPSPSGRVT